MRNLALISIPLATGFGLVSIATWRFYRIDQSRHIHNLAAVEDIADARRLSD
jgi:sensor domain CHASE-containing protein